MSGYSLIATCAALAVLLLSCSVASATTVELTKYDGVYPAASFNGSDAVGAGATPAFTGLDLVDIDQASNMIYAASNERIYKFNFAGVSQPFSGLGGNTVFTQSSGFYGDLEVDNSGTATQGNIYVVNDSSSFYGFGPSGTPLPGFPVSNGGETCGLAVGPDGHIWANNYPNTVKEYDPATIPPTLVKTVTFSPSVSGACDFDVDALGNFLVPDFYGGGPVYKYPPSGSTRTLIDSTTSTRTVAADLSNNHIYVDTGSTIKHFDSAGGLIDSFGAAEGAPTEYPGLQSSHGLAIDKDTHKVYVANARNPQRVDRFAPTGPIVIPTVATTAPDVEPTSAILRGTVNGDGIDTTDCVFEWGTTTNYGNTADCTEGDVFAGASGTHAVSAPIAGLTKGTTYHFRISAKNANNVYARGGDYGFTASGLPVAVAEGVSRLNTDGAQFNVTIDPNGGVTSYHIDWGSEAGVYGNTVPVPDRELSTKTTAESFSHFVSGLTADTVYHYRITAHNDAGTYVGPDRQFKTFPPPPPNDPCPNALERKQTSASLLLDCRAYELVSAADQGGYDVETDLVEGQQPLTAYPRAKDKLLYSLHYGALAGAVNPTNFGLDPYVATRGDRAWTSAYVGLPATGLPSTNPYGSPLLGADADLSIFAFGGPNICNPCFADGSTNVPLRLSDGALVKGMAGSNEPGPANPVGEVREPFSENGAHFIFGSDKKFETAGNTGSVSIYDRNLGSGVVQVVSTLPNGSTMTGAGIAELDVSADGSRVLIGKLVGTDAEGNEYFDLYMHVGSNQKSVLVADTLNGVLYNGMTDDGEKVFFTTPDSLADDADASADLFRADVGTETATVARISSGTGGAGNTNACAPVGDWNVVAGGPNCGTLAFAGGAGVASGDGTVYFLSPEKLDGVPNGTQDQPNLYVARPGQAPNFVATIDLAATKTPVDHPAVLHAREQAATHSYGDFQVTPDGHYAAFTSRLALTPDGSNGNYKIHRYDAVAEALDCASCGPSAVDSVLSSTGLNLTDDGRVFFTSRDQYVLRDTNEKKDAYEWKDGVIQLISSGTSPVDSGLLSVSADGVDAFFFTRDTLAPQDENGSPMKIYDAREGGGFLYTAPPFPCAASDECHGAGTQAAPPPDIDTVEGSGRAPVTKPLPKRCKRGFVRKRGKCVRRKPRHRKARSHG